MKLQKYQVVKILFFLNFYLKIKKIMRKTDKFRQYFCFIILDEIFFKSTKEKKDNLLSDQ